MRHDTLEEQQRSMQLDERLLIDSADRTALDVRDFDSYSLTGRSLPSPRVPIVELLERMKRMEVKQDAMHECEKSHHSDAATKTDITEHDRRVLTVMEAQNVALNEAVDGLQAELARTSLRAHFLSYATVAVVVSAIITALVVFRGGLVIPSPVPQFGLLVSLVLFWIAYNLPKESPEGENGVN